MVLKQSIHRPSQLGYTAIELMVTLTLAGLLIGGASLAFVSYHRQTWEFLNAKPTLAQTTWNPWRTILRDGSGIQFISNKEIRVKLASGHMRYLNADSIEHALKRWSPDARMIEWEIEPYGPQSSGTLHGFSDPALQILDGSMDGLISMDELDLDHSSHLSGTELYLVGLIHFKLMYRLDDGEHEENMWVHPRNRSLAQDER